MSMTSETSCPYCQQSFFDRSNLNRHLKNSQSCTKFRTDSAEKTTCTYCKKDFFSIYTLDRHYKVCKSLLDSKFNDKFSSNSELVQLKINYASLEAENKLLKQQLLDLKESHNEQIKDLKSSYQDLLEKYSQSKVVNNNNNNTTNNNYNSTNNTNNLTIKQIVSKLDPISYDDISDSMKNLTNDYIDSGVKGFARFLCDYSCGRKFITTDASRNTIAYRTNFDEFIRDPECLNLIDKSLKQNSNDIIEKANKRLKYYSELIQTSGDSFENLISEDKIFSILELKKIASLAGENNPNLNIKEIANILSQHGSQTYNKYEKKVLMI